MEVSEGLLRGQDLGEDRVCLRQENAPGIGQFEPPADPVEQWRFEFASPARERRRSQPTAVRFSAWAVWVMCNLSATSTNTRSCSSVMIGAPMVFPSFRSCVGTSSLATIEVLHGNHQSIALESAAPPVVASVLQDVAWLGAGGEWREVGVRLSRTMLPTAALTCGFVLAALISAVAPVFRHTTLVYATMPRNATALAPEAPIWSAFSALAVLPPLDTPASRILTH